MSPNYLSDGYEIFKGLLDAHVGDLREAVRLECNRFRAGAEEHAQFSVSLARYVEKFPDRNPGVTPDDVELEPYILGGIAALAPAFRVAITTQALWDRAASLLQISTGHVVYQSGQVVRKPTRVGPALGWHRDYGATYISTEGSRFLRMLIPLHDMSEVNGGTALVPRSNLISDEEASASIGTLDEPTDHLCPVLTAGDVLAIHPKQYMAVASTAATSIAICS